MKIKKKFTPRESVVFARKNEQIKISEVFLIDQNGKSIGIVSTKEALSMAMDAELDLVEISPNAKPPVCKIIDYGKFKYLNSKKGVDKKVSSTGKKQKEIHFGINIGDHDLDVKTSRGIEFLTGGNTLKVVLELRFPELSRMDEANALMNRALEKFGEKAKVITQPKLAGKKITAILAPSK